VEISPEEATVIVELILDSIVQALGRGEKVEVRGFGSFRRRQRRGRIARNPRTGGRVEVPPKKIPYFKPSKELRERVERIRMGH
jgi:integration host factor subunit beta